MGDVALITGANKGIGLEVAATLGRAGLTVLVGARNPALGEAAAADLRAQGLDARFLEVDLGRPETLAAASAAVARDFGRLDVLVNNAGISDAHDGPPSTASLDAVRRLWETNFLGTLAVTQAFLPLVRQAAAGRIVNVSSGLGSLANNGDPTWEFAPVKRVGYNSSKAALNMLTVQLAFELAGTRIKVNAADPGFTATDLNQHRGTQTLAEGARAIVKLATLGPDGPTGGYFDAEGPLPW